MKKIFLLLLAVLAVPLVLGADTYKPYLHTPSVPKHPEVKLFGQYATDLFPGAGTYSFPLEVPRGINGLSPSLVVSYNSQSVRGRPGVLGAGWFFAQDVIYRDINGTVTDATDDKYIMILDKIPYLLRYNSAEGLWHTEVEYHFRIQNLSTTNNTYGQYWLITKKDGTQYRYGESSSSEQVSSAGYATRWNLDLITDTHENTIAYSYQENPFSQDVNASYLDRISYNGNIITFVYESSLRPDRRRMYEAGVLVEHSRRLSDVSIFAQDAFVRRYHFNYSQLSSSLSALSSLSSFGTDNLSAWYAIYLSYGIASTGFTNTSVYSLPVAFGSGGTDQGVRLADVNNDGFGDIVQRDGTNNKIWLNNKNTAFVLSSLVLPENITAGGADQGTRLVDVNNDGFTDVVFAKAGTRRVYIHNTSAWALSSAWLFPMDIVDGSGNDQGIQILDLNGDGKADIFRSKQGLPAEIFLGNGTGWRNRSSSWPIPIDFLTSAGEDTGARLVDINGDGLPDILRSTSSLNQSWLNNGSGFVNSSPQWYSPSAFIDSSNKDRGVRLIDLNGDGLVDIAEQNTSAWLNNGTGWEQNNSWVLVSPMIVGSENNGRRLADVNGDGFTDIIVSTGSANFTLVKSAHTPFVLTSILNEYGGVTDIAYTTSTQFNNTVQNVSQIGFNIFVVSNVTQNNSLTGAFALRSFMNYSYAFGRYNYEDSEFRGFGLSIEESNSSLKKHYFYQDSPRRGKEYQTEVYSRDGRLFSKTLKEWNYTYAFGAYNLSLLYASNFLYDGQTVPFVTNETFGYGAYENLHNITYHGDVNLTGDEKRVQYDYAVNTIPWIVNKVARKTLYDSNDNVVGRTTYYYDGLGLGGVSVGDLTKVEVWSSDGNHSITTNTYDTYGNRISSTDPLGGTRKWVYDATNVFPVREINALGHITNYGYDLRFGVQTFVERNDIRTEFVHDQYGRILKEILPFDNADLPTKQYTYHFDGTAPEWITVKARTLGDSYDNVTYIYDGFANLIQIKTGVEDGQEIVKNLHYDPQFRLVREDNPYFASITNGYSTPTAIVSTNYTYDAMDRVVRVDNPDGTYKAVIFDRVNITDTDENGNNHTYTVDAYGRISHVYEYNNDSLVGLQETYTTTYEYDARDNLIQIIDNEGNTFEFTYDSRGRKTATTDPDLGTWEYFYDNNNNLVRQEDNRNISVNLSYDALNRILSKIDPNGTIRFSYDVEYYGTLTNMSIGNDSISFIYDERLRKIRETHEVEGASIPTTYLYDSQNRLVSSNTFQPLNYFFNKLGMVKKINGYVSDASYDAFGGLLNRTYGNGIVTTYTYDVRNHRLNGISSTVQEMTYSYDNVGNILSLHDSLQARNYSMSYDRLDRLVHTAINDDQYTYAYNSIGNILKIQKNNESTRFVYGGNQAHAPSQVIEGTAGVDVHKPIVINSGNRNRTVEFFLVNEQESTLSNVNWTLNFGDNQQTSDEDITIENYVWAFVESNYSAGGAYELNATAVSPGTSDTELFSTTFGLSSTALNVLLSNISERTLELKLTSDIAEPIRNTTWNCSQGLSPTMLINFTGILWDYLQLNYSSPGVKNFACNATSADGTGSSSTTFTVEGLEVENYDVLTTNASQRIVVFDVENNFHSLETNVSVEAENHVFSTLANISSSTRLMVFSEVNYTSDDVKHYTIDLSAANATDSHIDSFKTLGATIENYARVESGDKNVFLFDVRNNWVTGAVTWALSQPALTNTTIVNNNNLLLVFIEDNSSTAGSNSVVVNATTSEYIDHITDLFQTTPLEILDFQLNTSTATTGTYAFTIHNNLDTSQIFSWRLDTGIANRTSTAITLGANTNQTFTIVENYTTFNIYRTQLDVNTSLYTDNRTGVVRIE